MLAQEMVNTVVQLTVALLIAGLAWAAFGRRKAGFAEWLGLVRPARGWARPTLVLFLAILAVTLPIFLLTPLIEAVTAGNTVGGKFAGQPWGFGLLATIAIMAFVKTALSEEILFRGLIARRLIAWLGFARGNALQAALFGSVHLSIFAVPNGPEPTPLAIAALFFIPSAAGWLMGYANQRYGGGSIVPGWTIHAGGNFLAYMSFAT